MYRITFQNDNGWAISHVDVRLTGGPETRAQYANIVANALHPIGCAGRYTFRELTDADIAESQLPERTNVANVCLHPGDVLVESGDTVMFVQKRGSNVCRGTVRLYLEDHKTKNVYHVEDAAHKMVEVIRERS